MSEMAGTALLLLVVLTAVIVMFGGEGPSPRSLNGWWISWAGSVIGILYATLTRGFLAKRIEITKLHRLVTGTSFFAQVGRGPTKMSTVNSGCAHRFCASLPDQVPTEYWMYVGTYTGYPGREGKGIYAFRFLPSTGELAEVGLVAETPNPSFLVIHRAGTSSTPSTKDPPRTRAWGWSARSRSTVRPASCIC
jgi:hypothetical protein